MPLTNSDKLKREVRIPCTISLGWAADGAALHLRMISDASQRGRFNVWGLSTRSAKRRYQNQRAASSEATGCLKDRFGPLKVAARGKLQRRTSSSSAGSGSE